MVNKCSSKILLMFLFAWFVKGIIKANVNVCKLNEDISIWKSLNWCVHAGTYYFKLTFSYESFPLPGLRPRDIRSIDPSLFLTNSMPSLLVLYQLIFVICGSSHYVTFFLLLFVLFLGFSLLDMICLLRRIPKISVVLFECFN